MVHHVWMASTATRAIAQRDSLERTAIKVKSSGFHLCFDKYGVIYGTGERYGKHELAQFFSLLECKKGKRMRVKFSLIAFLISAIS